MSQCDNVTSEKMSRMNTDSSAIKRTVREYQEQLWGFPVGSVVKNVPTMQETWIRSLGQEDLQEKEMATHFSILAWEVPQTEEPGGLQSIGSHRIGHD